ncbi:MAG: MBL fold metallo-hydrolase, partial [Bacteroidota bacterium]
MIHTLDLQFQVTEVIGAFVVETTEGPVLVETGPYSVFEHLIKGLARFGYEPSDIRHVFLTHIHFDHAGAAWALAREGATIYVHPRGYKHLHDPSRLYGSAKRIYGDMMEKLWGEMHGIPEELLVAVEDGQKVTVGEKEFIAWYTPGHASHHIAWQVGESVFAGDVAGVKILNGPIVPPCPPPDIDIEAWEVSIDKLLSLNPTSLYLTHYGKVEDVEAHLTTLRKVLRTWADWIKPYFDEQVPQMEIVPKFTAWVEESLKEHGLDKATLAKYHGANPAYMSVAGLMRYWQKK